MIIYEIVPDEDYVVQDPKLMCRDSITAKFGRELAAAITGTSFAAEPAKYAVEWVLQFYDKVARSGFRC
jgi:hypothetical protein